MDLSIESSQSLSQSNRSILWAVTKLILFFLLPLSTFSQTIFHSFALSETVACEHGNYDIHKWTISLKRNHFICRQQQLINNICNIHRNFERLKFLKTSWNRWLLFWINLSQKWNQKGKVSLIFSWEDKWFDSFFHAMTFKIRTKCIPINFIHPFRMRFINEISS